MARLKLAYGLKDDIEDKIEEGKIPPGTLVLTSDSNELYFYNLDCALCAYTEKYKFNSKSEAEDWIEKYNCRGEILSIHEGDRCNVYIVDYNNELVKFEREVPDFSRAQADWHEEDPDSPAYIKNKPDLLAGNDKYYVHTQMSPSEIWDVNHFLNKYPAITVVDSAGNIVVGDVKYLNNNRVMLEFSGAFSGVCYCN